MEAAVATVVDEVVLRAATDADRELLLAVYASTRAAELDQVAWPPGAREAFLEMQFSAQDAEYHRVNPNASFDVIEVGGVAAGRFYVDRQPGEIRIIDLALLPDFRGVGIGGRLLSGLLEEASGSGSKVTLHVEATNRAGRLYERLGFVVVAEQGFHRRMEWTR
jgi:ribosomal protein S18 acetylase RimI-like enzyme